MMPELNDIRYHLYIGIFGWSVVLSKCVFDSMVSIGFQSTMDKVIGGGKWWSNLK